MALIRLDGGDLWVGSPIARGDDLHDEIDALGRVRHLVSSNKIHHLRLGGWAQANPNARLYASPGVARRRDDLDFDAELGDQPAPA